MTRPLVWFRSDLRTKDNPALAHAAGEASSGVVAVFLVSSSQWREHDWAPVKVEFIRRNLVELSAQLWQRRIPLLIRTVEDFDDAADELLDVALHHGCDGLVYNREYEVNERRRDRSVSDAFEAAGLDVRAFTGRAILPPGSVRTKQRGWYSVFTPYKNAWLARLDAAGMPALLPAPTKQGSTAAEPDDVPESIDGFEVDTVRADLWPAGEREAARRLTTFVRDRIERYEEDRNAPAIDGTSALSPYLAAGVISPRQCLTAAVDANGGRTSGGKDGPRIWIEELIWREFYQHVLLGAPRVSMHLPYKPETDQVRWRDDDDGFAAWCAGRTGIPIVDAAMRQLAETGWMHNRLRMVAAMFLTKNLLVDWRRGEEHFMRNLVDGDLASNNGGWQWSASTGTDAAPYFRVFNPVSQSRKFDSGGVFIRRYVPELAALDDKAIHEPSALPKERRSELDYPGPIVDLKTSRVRAIEAFERIKK